MEALLDLVLKELFEFGLMQTDPNFANYRWQGDSGRIVLLDFGATRPVAAQSADDYRTLLRAGMAGDIPSVRHALVTMGFISSSQMSRHGATLDAMIGLAMRHIHDHREGLFDFGNRDIVTLLRDQAAPMLADRSTWHLPPTEKLFTQRKISGMALLCANMRARLPLMKILSRYS
jgi:predicted unusual protein kinase regulating ubiquinone biosynthesis (AarF/ABC1/UbiB family)